MIIISFLYILWDCSLAFLPETFWRQIEKDRLSDDKGPPSADHASSSRVLECDENSDTEGDSNTEDDNDCDFFDNEAKHTWKISCLRGVFLEISRPPIEHVDAKHLY